MSARTAAWKGSFWKAGKLLIQCNNTNHHHGKNRQECQRGKTASVRRDGGGGSFAAQSQGVSFGGIWESSGSRTRERPRSAKGRNRRSRQGDQEINQQVCPQC